MPRLTQAVPKYRLHRQSGQAIVTINGRDHLLGPHKSKASKIEYDRLIGEWLASGRSASYGAPKSDYAVVELAADYMRWAKGYYGEGSTSEYHRVLPAVRLLRELYGRTAVDQFGPLQLKSLRQRFVAQDWARSYVNHQVRRIARMFRWAASEGKVPPAVPHALAMVAGLRKGKTKARETKPVLPVDDEIVDATLPFMPEVTADMVRLQRLTGMRPAEVCIMRPCDIDRSGEIWLYRPESHKTEHHGHERVVPVGPKAQAVLLRYLARAAEDNCFRPCDSMARHFADRNSARTTPLSCGNRPGTNRKRKPRKTPGKKYAVDAYRRAISRACDKAFPHVELSTIRCNDLTPAQLKELKAWQSSKRWAPNQLRHAAATEVRREFGLEAAQIVLGHSQANVTEIYAERDLAKGLEVAKRIG